MWNVNFLRRQAGIGDILTLTALYKICIQVAEYAKETNHAYYLTLVWRPNILCLGSQTFKIYMEISKCCKEMLPIKFTCREVWNEFYK